MNIDNILTPDRTFCNIETRSKKKAIEDAAQLIAGKFPALKSAEIYNGLIAREKLGPTALGDGIALPHCRIEGCTDIVGALFTLSDAVDFGAFDDQPVKIMFVLLVPANEVDEHLKAMAMLAERFQIPAYRENLISATSDHELYEKAMATTLVA